MLLSKLKPNPDNPRIIKDGKFKQLVQSIKDFPQMMALRPIIYDSKMVVLGGNMRLAALKELGYKELPDEWVKPAKGLTDDQKREFIVKDNVGFGEWNWEQLANEWDQEKLQDWGLDLPATGEGGDGFNDEGIAPKSQYGVIVICADEAEQEQVFSRLRGEGLTCKIVVT
jgi:ParB-like chromosome segregation protein Spo0J